MRKALVFTILLIATAISAAAQEVVYSVDFNTTINNREGGDEQTPDQTFIFTRLNPEVGVKLVDDNQGTHLLKGGVVWYQPMHDGGGCTCRCPPTCGATRWATARAACGA